jgi:hypothetical protein
MTTHVVCLDGTGQTRLQPNPTNIAFIFNAMGGIIVDAERLVRIHPRSQRPRRAGR